MFKWAPNKCVDCTVNRFKLETTLSCSEHAKNFVNRKQFVVKYIVDIRQRRETRKLTPKLIFAYIEVH